MFTLFFMINIIFTLEFLLCKCKTYNGVNSFSVFTFISDGLRNIDRPINRVFGFEKRLALVMTDLKRQSVIVTAVLIHQKSGESMLEHNVLKSYLALLTYDK